MTWPTVNILLIIIGALFFLVGGVGGAKVGNWLDVPQIEQPPVRWIMGSVGFILLGIGIWMSMLPLPTLTAGATSPATFTPSTWRGQGTFYDSRQAPFTMVLTITSVTGNTFEGTLREDTYKSTVAITGRITSTSGETLTIIFTDPSAISGDGIQLSCTYTATVAKGQMNGSWSCPGSSSPQGTISLSQKA